MDIDGGYDDRCAVGMRISMQKEKK